jgi:outer membrane protein OmpA-like peptidoglycan-associated protein
MALGQSAASWLWRRRHSLRYFLRDMSAPTLHRSAVVAALLGLALLDRAIPDAMAATADRGDVQVNLDVLDSLGPAGGAAPDANQIHLHAPPPKIKATTRAVAIAPQSAPLAPATTAKATVARRESASPAAIDATGPIAPPAAGGDALPAAAPSPAPAAMAAPSPAPAPVAAVTMNAPPEPAKPPASSPSVAAAPVAAPSPVPTPVAAVAMDTPPEPAKPAASSPSPAAAPAPATPHPAPTRVVFAAGITDLPDVAKAKLDALAEWLDANQRARIEVVAYAAGSAEQANDARRTSLTRALAVRSYLAQHGIATIRMEVRALGNHSAEGDPPDRVDIAMMDH